MDGETVRRSGRARAPNKKYANDIRDFSPDPEVEEQITVPIDDTGKDADFNVDAVERAEEEVIQSDDSDSSVRTPVGEGNTDDESKAPDTTPKPGEFGRRFIFKHSGQSLAKSKSKPHEDFHTRGHSFNDKATSARSQVVLLAGHDEADASALRWSVIKWANEISVPKNMANPSGAGGMAHHPLYTLEMRHAEAEESHKWYDGEGGRTLMQAAQRVQSLEPNDSQRYYPTCYDEQRFLHGPYDAQAMYAAQPMQPAPLHLTWRTESHTPEEATQSEHYELSHQGWLLNLGARPRRMAWAPHHSGDKQYLAISTSKDPPTGQKNLSAFVPTSEYPACIQMWAFAASAVKNGYRTMDVQTSPMLIHAICSDWGSAKELSWNPASFDHKKQDNLIRLGLLGGIWSDGFVRILDVWVPNGGSDSHQVHGEDCLNGLALEAWVDVLTLSSQIQWRGICSKAGIHCVHLLDLDLTYEDRSRLR